VNVKKPNQTKPLTTQSLTHSLSSALGMDSVVLHSVSASSAASSSSTPSMAKRPCPSQNPRVENLSDVERLLDAFLSLSDLPSLALDLSFERLLQSVPSDPDLIDRALKMGSLLLDAAKHSSRKRASNHNSLAWPLPPDLTIKVTFASLPFFRSSFSFSFYFSINVIMLCYTLMLLPFLCFPFC